MEKKIILSLFMFFQIFICSSQVPFKKYHEEEYSFEFNPSWNIIVDKTGIVQIVSKKENEGDDFQESINVVKYFNNEEIKLKDFLDLTIEKIKLNFGKRSIVDSKDVNFLKFKAKEIIYVISILSPKDKLEKLKIKQRLLLNNNKFYVITYTAKSEDFSKYLDEVEKIFNSFVFN